MEKEKVLHAIADTAARTGTDMKQLHCIQPREGDTVLAFWDSARSLGQTAIACAVFVKFPTGNFEMVCMMTRKIETINDEGGELVALRMLQDVLLHAQGLRLQPQKGLFSR